MDAFVLLGPAALIAIVVFIARDVDRKDRAEERWDREHGRPHF